MLIGIASRRARYESSGCFLFSGGAFIQALVTAMYLNETPFLTIWSIISLFLFGVAGVLRAMFLLRGERFIWIKK